MFSHHYHYQCELSVSSFKKFSTVFLNEIFLNYCKKCRLISHSRGSDRYYSIFRKISHVRARVFHKFVKKLIKINVNFNSIARNGKKMFKKMVKLFVERKKRVFRPRFSINQNFHRYFKSVCF